MLRALSFLLASRCWPAASLPAAARAAGRTRCRRERSRRRPGHAKVAVLLPLTGPNAGLGRDLLRAVQLALGPDGPQPDVQDTRAPRPAPRSRRRLRWPRATCIIVGPLTAPETAAAAAVAQRHPDPRLHVGPAAGAARRMAARASRRSSRSRGWCRRLSRAGKTRVAAVLPDNCFGDALADGLSGRPRWWATRRPRSGATRRGARQRSTRRCATCPTMRTAGAGARPGRQADPLRGHAARNHRRQPPPFDALLLAESGPALQPVAAPLPSYGISRRRAGRRAGAPGRATRPISAG